MIREEVGGKRGTLWAPLEVEARVLAVVIVSRGAKWPEGIATTAFYSGLHAAVWQVCRRLQRERGELAWGVEDVGEALRGRVPMVTMIEIVHTLARVPRLDFEADCATVREASARRRFAAKCDEWAGRLRHTDEPVACVIAEAERSIGAEAGLVGAGGGA